MKTTISLILSVLMLFHCPEIDRKPRAQEQNWVGPVIIIAGAVVATCYIIYVNAHNDQPRIHRLVLQKSPTLDRQNWVGIATNDFHLTPEQFWPVFAARMGKNAEIYRIIEIPIPPGGIVNVMRYTVFVGE